MKRLLGNAALLAASLIVAILLAEVLLRLTDQRYSLTPAEFPDGYFVNDDVLGARHAAGHPPTVFRFKGPHFETFTNSLGCFDVEQVILPGYVLVLGDSVTWGYVPVEENWATHLARLSGRQIVKCGVAGIGTRYETALLEDLVGRIGMPPADVILLYTMNDLNDDVLFPSHRVVAGQRLDAFRSLDLATGELERYPEAELAAQYAEYQRAGPSLRQWLRENSLVSWLVYRALLAKPDPPPPPPVISARYEVHLWELEETGRPWLVAARKAHLANLFAMSEIVRDMGAHFIVFDHDEGPHNEVLAAQLAGRVDFYHRLTFDDAAMPQSDRYFHPFDGHWSVEGNRMAAEEMHRALYRNMPSWRYQAQARRKPSSSPTRGR